MIGALRNGGRLILAGILPTDLRSYDRVSKETKTGRSFETRGESLETGWDRLNDMFHLDEFGGISCELNSIYQSGFLGFLIGAVYGGVIRSRKAYIDFMENNEATAFKSHLDAKRKLQDQFTVNFAKGALKWGWRIALFTTSYVAIITTVSVYRGKSSIYEYLAAGSITGALFRAHLGLRGLIAGGIVGTALGGVAGGASLLILWGSGTSMEEVRYWQYKWKLARESKVKESMQVPDPELLKQHDEKVSADLSLDKITK